MNNNHAIFYVVATVDTSLEKDKYNFGFISW